MLSLEYLVRLLFSLFYVDVTNEYFYEDGLIRVNSPNPLYYDSPYTLQLGGCGAFGEYIHLTPNYLTHIGDTSDENFGPHDNIFVHEWSKLRYVKPFL